MRVPLAPLALTAAAAATALTLGAAPASSSGGAATSSTGLQVVGLAAGGDRLVAFRADAPGGSRVTGRVTGLVGDRRLVGIDHRAADGRLYGLGDRGGIYTLTQAGRATRAGQLTVPLQGTGFGVDVNPAADALRIVSNTGQNLRQSFATPFGPTTEDTRLTTPPAEGDTRGVVGAAYTNNDSSTDTATTLYDINMMTDQVAVQAPANNGTLSPTGSLGVDVNGEVGFDIYSTVRGGKAVGQRAFATLRTGGTRAFYEITLFNGEARRIGTLPQDVIDIALPLAQR